MTYRCANCGKKVNIVWVLEKRINIFEEEEEMYLCKDCEYARRDGERMVLNYGVPKPIVKKTAPFIEKNIGNESRDPDRGKVKNKKGGKKDRGGLDDFFNL